MVSTPAVLFNVRSLVPVEMVVMDAEGTPRSPVDWKLKGAFVPRFIELSVGMPLWEIITLDALPPVVPLAPMLKVVVPVTGVSGAVLKGSTGVALKVPMLPV